MAEIVEAHVIEVGLGAQGLPRRCDDQRSPWPTRKH